MTLGGETTGATLKSLESRSTSLESDLTNTRTTRHGDCSLPCTHNAMTFSSDANRHALLDAADRIKFHVAV
ncbi:unnamed protein product [Angiostrongylus costaricensis]|uniref:Uncharacterized protein n=1 Tax=Angiostrongylus costaricensis TaxID=334426 RepID=A0A0R3PGL0_ANGCS|nr:unnamed protein product [Angiostrongylus costaricensis]